MKTNTEILLSEWEAALEELDRHVDSRKNLDIPEPRCFFYNRELYVILRESDFTQLNFFLNKMDSQILARCPTFTSLIAKTGAKKIIMPVPLPEFRFREVPEFYQVLGPYLDQHTTGSLSCTARFFHAALKPVRDSYPKDSGIIEKYERGSLFQSPDCVDKIAQKAAYYLSLKTGMPWRVVNHCCLTIAGRSITPGGDEAHILNKDIPAHLESSGVQFKPKFFAGNRLISNHTITGDGRCGAFFIFNFLQIKCMSENRFQSDTAFSLTDLGQIANLLRNKIANLPHNQADNCEVNFSQGEIWIEDRFYSMNGNDLYPDLIKILPWFKLDELGNDPLLLKHTFNKYLENPLFLEFLLRACPTPFMLKDKNGNNYVTGVSRLSGDTKGYEIEAVNVIGEYRSLKVSSYDASTLNTEKLDSVQIAMQTHIAEILEYYDVSLRPRQKCSIM